MTWSSKGAQTESTIPYPKSLRSLASRVPTNAFPLVSLDSNHLRRATAYGLHPPLLDDTTRIRDLSSRLRTNWLGYVYDETHVDSFVQTQLPIEKHIEAALVEDGYARQSVLEKIDQIRGFIFYPEGKALSLKAYSNHLTQIETVGTRNSIPYRQVRRALHYYHLFLERR